MDYERRQIYRGPEKFVDLPADAKEQAEMPSMTY
jgi:penicillin-binding protein 1A